MTIIMQIQQVGITSHPVHFKLSRFVSQLKPHNKREVAYYKINAFHLSQYFVGADVREVPSFDWTMSRPGEHAFIQSNILLKCLHRQQTM